MMRFDKALVEKGLCATRAKAQDAIKEGRASINGIMITKNSTLVTEEDILKIVHDKQTFVSRAGWKLYDVLDPFGIQLKDRIVMDVGASTGGFSDVCLRQGAACVYALDVGCGQMDSTLLKNPRLHNMEHINCRYIKSSMFDQPIDFACIDVSFISLRLIMKSVISCMDSIEIVALIKPQFEAGKSDIGKNGIVKDKRVHLRILQELHAFFQSCALYVHHIQKSSVVGRDGNQEYVVHLKSTPANKAMSYQSVITANEKG